MLGCRSLPPLQKGAPTPCLLMLLFHQQLSLCLGPQLFILYWTLLSPPLLPPSLLLRQVSLVACAHGLCHLEVELHLQTS